MAMPTSTIIATIAKFNLKKMKHEKRNSSFDSSNSINLSKDEKEGLNISNLVLEEVLNIDDIIGKMINYKNKSIFAV